MAQQQNANQRYNGNYHQAQQQQQQQSDHYNSSGYDPNQRYNGNYHQAQQQQQQQSGYDPNKTYNGNVPIPPPWHYTCTNCETINITNSKPFFGCLGGSAPGQCVVCLHLNWGSSKDKVSEKLRHVCFVFRCIIYDDLFCILFVDCAECKSNEVCDQEEIKTFQEFR